MPRRPTLARRLTTAVVWPFGICLTSWHYMWRTTPLHRREVVGLQGEDSPPPLPAGVSQEELQPAEDGVGPLFHRAYSVTIHEPSCSAEELMAVVTSDPNQAAPTEFARFHKIAGDKGTLRVGDEFVVRMPGPWDGPVRVIAVTPLSFRLATLTGHLEAGQIEFRVSQGPSGPLSGEQGPSGPLSGEQGPSGPLSGEQGPRTVEFAIESWARSGDRLSNLMYQQLHMAKEVQLHMWTSFLEQAAGLAGGRVVGGIRIETRRVDEMDDGGRPLQHPDGKALLDELHAKQFNFDVDGRSEYTPENGWMVDNYRQPLPSEPPGDPVPGGPWEVAQGLIRDYEFADPSIVRAVYEPDGPLDERDMLLEARFHGLRFQLGVRVGGVRDETRDVDGRKVRVWGWNYRTLQGHLEMGQMDYEIWKWLDTGEVDFVICRFSRRASVRNPIVKLGLRLFGRREQERFVRRACERMTTLTAAALDQDPAKDVPRVADQVELRPAAPADHRPR